MLVTEKAEKVARVAVIGLGGRGTGTLQTLLEMENVIVPAVCDLYQDRVDNAVKIATEGQGIAVAGYTDYKELLKRDDIEGVLITSSWAAHCYIAADAMYAGKYAAIECGGGASLDELWQIVRAYERTGVPCMALENCCYDRKEMAVLRMIKEGVFGEIIHTEGGYGHDLRDEISYGRENRHYRFDNYKNRNADLYPGHAIGPMAKYLNINRGNRMVSLVSMASKSCGLHQYLMREKGPDYDASHYQWAEGDIVQTMIKCAHGETILLTHDTTLPRYYSRFGCVRGTKGMWEENGMRLFLENDSTKEQPSWSHTPTNFEEHWQEYEHPLWKEYQEKGIHGGHGGMDGLVLSAFIDSIINHTDTPTDAYDAAAWMAITVLSEQSIAMGSAPVAFPDFTDGKWIHRKPYVRSKYCLDEVCYDLFEDDKTEETK